MPIVKAVTSGEPITAAWANSVVSEVNKTQAIDLSSGMSFRNGSRGIKQTLSDPAFQIRYSYGTYTLNAGQIYINGQLVKPTTKQQKAGEESGIVRRSRSRVRGASYCPRGRRFCLGRLQVP